jgi:hypothetical protein
VSYPVRPMNWFQREMGFREEDPDQVRANLALEGEEIVSRVNGARLGCGRLELPSLAELRAADSSASTAACTVAEVIGDVTALHRDPGNAGALFQVASQFNLLEMVGPSVTPEQGVGIYDQDRTQGPACAIACGGGTIYRNYFLPFLDGVGQTAERQVDCLADLEAELGPGLWRMRNGYALATEAGLREIGARLAGSDAAERDRLRGLLRVGLHRDVEVLGAEHRVTQVYGSALPVAYGRLPSRLWEPFARLVLEASYEATLRAARTTGAATVFLTYLGGGAFGNDEAWIADAIGHALDRVGGLDVRLVSYGRPSGVAGMVRDRCEPE